MDESEQYSERKKTKKEGPPTGVALGSYHSYTVIFSGYCSPEQRDSGDAGELLVCNQLWK
jgi:hypothetical protein